MWHGANNLLIMKTVQERIKLAEAKGWTQIHEHEGKLWGIVPNADELDSQGALERYYEIPEYAT